MYPRIKKTLRLLQDRCKLIQELPIERLRPKTLFANRSLPSERLKYQQARSDTTEGFAVAFDKRKEKRKARKDGDQMLKYGQIKPFPTNFEWTFDWETSTKELKEFLKSKTVVGFDNRPSKERPEILDHLTGVFHLLPPLYPNPFPWFRSYQTSL